MWTLLLKLKQSVFPPEVVLALGGGAMLDDLESRLICVRGLRLGWHRPKTGPVHQRALEVRPSWITPNG
jgi:hypothetical protein